MDKLKSLESKLKRMVGRREKVVCAKAGVRMSNLVSFMNEMDLVLDKRYDSLIREASDNVAKAKAARDAYKEGS